MHGTWYLAATAVGTHTNNKVTCHEEHARGNKGDSCGPGRNTRRKYPYGASPRRACFPPELTRYRLYTPPSSTHSVNTVHTPPSSPSASCCLLSSTYLASSGLGKALDIEYEWAFK